MKKINKIIMLLSVMMMLLMGSVMAVESSITGMNKPTGVEVDSSFGSYNVINAFDVFMSDSERGGAYDFGLETTGNARVTFKITTIGFGTSGFEIVIDGVYNDFFSTGLITIGCGTDWEQEISKKPSQTIGSFTLDGSFNQDIADITIPSSCFEDIYDDNSEYIWVETANGQDISQIYGYVQVAVPPNTEPVINSISPSERIELRNGESQTYTLDVTDTEADASYQWVLGSTTVGTNSSSYTANYDDIEAGIYTLTAYVSDAEYNNSISTTLEIRAKGGSSSGGSSTAPAVIPTENANENLPEQASERARSRLGELLQNFFNFFRNLFGGN